MFAVSCSYFEGGENPAQDKTVNIRIVDPKAVSDGVGIIFRGGSLVKADAVAAKEGLYSFVRPAAASGVAKWFVVSPDASGLIIHDGRDFKFAIGSTQYPQSPDRPQSVACPAFSRAGVISSDNVLAVDSLVTPGTVRTISAGGLLAGERVYIFNYISKAQLLSGTVRVFSDTVSVSMEPLSQVISAIFPDGVEADENGKATSLAGSVPGYPEDPAVVCVSTDSRYRMYDTDGSLMLSYPAVCFDFNSEALVRNLKTAVETSVQGSDGQSRTIRTSDPGCVSEGSDILPRSISIDAGKYLEIPEISGKEVTDCILVLAPDSAKEAVFSLETVDGRAVTSIDANLSGNTGSLVTISKEGSYDDEGIYSLSGLRLRAVSGTIRICAMTLCLKDYIDPKAWENGSISDNFNEIFDL